MRPKACRLSTSMPKRDTMHRSSNRFALIVLLAFSLSLCVFGQSGQSSQQSTQSQNPQQQQPVQDLTPPSDAEAEKTAAPAPAPNQPGETIQRESVATQKNSKDEQY